MRVLSMGAGTRPAVAANKRRRGPARYIDLTKHGLPASGEYTSKQTSEAGNPHPGDPNGSAGRA